MSGPVILGHGRWLIDAIPASTAFGTVWTWTIEDLDSDADDQVVATGRALDLVSVQHEVSTALLGVDGLARA